MNKRETESTTRRRPRSKQVRIARTPVGLGVFAQQRYYFDELIGEIEGEVIDDAEYTSSYCMDMGDTRCLEPAPPFRYMNHSCQPNCRFSWYDVSDDGRANLRRRVFVLALRPIEIGDELTIDYAWPPAMAIVCRCGTAECRGWIVAEEHLWRLTGEQAAHCSSDEMALLSDAQQLHHHDDYPADHHSN